MATLAMSPWCRYSTVSMPSGSTQPVPVGMTTISVERSKPPTRISSSSAIFARASAVPAALRPA